MLLTFIVCIVSIINSRELISQLLADGWLHVATRGSHWQFKHPIKIGKVTVPHPKIDLPK